MTPQPEAPPSQDPAPPTSENSSPYEEGKRAGVHPLVVVIGIILGLWFLLWVFMPASKNTRATNLARPPSASTELADEAPVMFTVKGMIPELNVLTLLVPPQTTESQVEGLLNRFRQARLDNTLSTLLPPTTPGNQLGNYTTAEIYVFSTAEFSKLKAVDILARGAHAPGDLYPQAIPFEVAMEQVRGHYRIDLHDAGHPDKASLGFADESGVHSKNYRPLF